ncbi:MAG: hypothetical protein ACI9MU_004256 [Alphaproteobacteria bacterium]|jgi:hypothetical protein
MDGNPGFGAWLPREHRHVNGKRARESVSAAFQAAVPTQDQIRIWHDGEPPSLGIRAILPQ